LISPTSATAGASDLTVTIAGSDFIDPAAPHAHYESFAVWADGTKAILPTRFDSSTQLTATVPSTLLTTAGTVKILIVNGDPMGYSDGFEGYPSSKPVTFTILR